MNRVMMVRSLFVAALVSIASAAMSSTATAQIKCGCERVRVVVDPGVQCRLIFCYRTGEGRRCDTLRPGEDISIPCDLLTGITFGIVDCNGVLQPIGDDCKAATPIAINQYCCVRACYTRDENNCITVQIFDSPAPCDKCP